MLEEKLIRYLAEETRLHVSNAAPEGQKPREYILVQRTNGGKTDYIASATYAIQSISRISKFRAAQINEIVKGIMEHFAEDPEISKCDLNSDYDYTNVMTKEYRYQAVFDIVYF